MTILIAFLLVIGFGIVGAVLVIAITESIEWLGRAFDQSTSFYFPATPGKPFAETSPMPEECRQ